MLSLFWEKFGRTDQNYVNCTHLCIADVMLESPWDNWEQWQYAFIRDEECNAYIFSADLKAWKWFQGPNFRTKAKHGFQYLHRNFKFGSERRSKMCLLYDWECFWYFSVLSSQLLFYVTSIKQSFMTPTAIWLVCEGLLETFFEFQKIIQFYHRKVWFPAIKMTW